MRKARTQLISYTQPYESEFQEPVADSPESLLAYCARVSSPNQENPKYEKLLSYCMTKGHWSVFEMADMTVEITTSRAIAQQILRHKSFSFQEFSQRYATANLGFEKYQARRQDVTNRQNSIDDMNEEIIKWFNNAQHEMIQSSQRLYEGALERGVAKEQARFLLPLSTQTKLYMKGSIRSWIHYLESRLSFATQKEHREIAEEIFTILCEVFPVVGKLIGEKMN